jgi:nucleotide-binding universal stress UspA family protein
MHLMRKCPCPVWVVRPSQPEQRTRILAAVDPCLLDGEDYAVSVKIMDLATVLARRQECELVVVHTWMFPAELPLRRGYLVASTELDGVISRTRQLHRRRLGELLRPYELNDLESQVYMLKGEPGHLIPELAAGMEVGLIVMATVSRTGVAGLLIGSTAERILRQVDCAVLAVKPDGFVTPVRLDAVH